jgi:hypothetical protein
MRSWIVSMLCLLTLSQAMSQNIVKAEYFLDTDPGYGNGAPIPLSPNADITLDFTVNLANVSPGQHVLFVRVMDEDGRWSLSFTRHFLKDQADVPPSIVEAEYYIDTDPNYGGGTPIPIASSEEIDTIFTVNLSDVSPGIHVLFVRARDANGSWSLSHTRQFVKEIVAGVPSFTHVEYFINTDPNFGNGETIATAGEMVDTLFVADLSGLPAGIHVMFVRVRDSDGLWSLSHTRQFVKDIVGVTPTLTQLEYFIDNDPGYGDGQDIPFAQGTKADTSFIVDLSSAPPGIHVLFVRAKDTSGVWSLLHTRQFVKEVVGIEPTVTALEYYLDSHTGEGLATSVPIESGETTEAAFLVDLGGLPPGTHTLGVRAKDSLGVWGIPVVRQFFLDGSAASPIVAVNFTLLKDSVTMAEGRLQSFPPATDLDLGGTVSTESLDTEGAYSVRLNVENQQGIRSNDYIHAFVTSTAPFARFSARSVSFGDVRVGSTKSVAFAITNVGIDTLEITSLSITDSAFTATTDTGRLASQGNRLDTLRFTPYRVGAFNAQFIIVSNGFGAPDTIRLSGVGVLLAQLGLSAQSVEMGPVPVGQHKDSTLQMMNTGNDPLRISSVESTDPRFVVVHTDSVIFPDSAGSISIRFVPDSVGNFSGHIIIHSNAPSSPDTIAVAGIGTTSTSVNIVPEIPTVYSLWQNYPNPFNPSTKFGFRIAEFGLVTLKVYNLLGQEVATLVNEEMKPGSYEVTWDASGMASGVYFYRLQAGSFVETKKLVLMR